MAKVDKIAYWLYQNSEEEFKKVAVNLVNGELTLIELKKDLKWKNTILYYEKFSLDEKIDSEKMIDFMLLCMSE